MNIIFLISLSIVLFFRNPELVQPGIYFYRSMPEQKFQETIDAIARKGKVEFCLAIVEKKNDELIRFGYGAKPESALQTTHLMLNHFSLIIKFNHYFLESAEEMITRAEDHSIDLTAFNPHFDQNSSFKAALEVDEKRNFLKAIKCHKFDKLFKLSVQEKECLMLLLKGHSASEIGKTMLLSCRTVEHYIENVKNKLDCHSKYELFEYAPILELN